MLMLCKHALLANKRAKPFHLSFLIRSGTDTVAVWWCKKTRARWFELSFHTKETSVKGAGEIKKNLTLFKVWKENFTQNSGK